jgi:uncharacterized protein
VKTEKSVSWKLNSHVGGALLATLLMWSSALPESPVADAAMRDATEQVRSLLQSGADVNAAQGDGMTALHWAAENKNAAVTEMLLIAGANPAAATRLGDYTALHLASKAGAASVIELLLEGGSDAGSVTSTGGASPLHFAAATGSAESVSALLRHGAEVDVREGMWHQTPLMFAAAAGRADVVNVLLDAGADHAVTARVMDMDQRSQEDGVDRSRQGQIGEGIRAAQEGRSAAAAGGRRGGPPQQGGPPQARGRSSAPPPQAAVTPPTAGSQQDIDNQIRDRVPSSRYSHAQLVGGYGGLTALHLAAREGMVRTAAALLDRGADVDQLTGGDLTSPLLMATINGHFDLAKMLLERGADVNLASHANATPLYTTLNTQWIPKSRHPQPADYMQQQVTYLELMEDLLKAGADVNVRLSKQLWFTTFGDDYLRTDRMGASPFWRAAYALDLPAMRLLIEYGADPNVPTLKTAGRRFGQGAGGSADLAAPTMDPSGLPPVAVGGPGAWPIHAASGVGYGEGFAANIHRVAPDSWLSAMRYLVEELGADVNARDHNGYTALHHAAARGDDELIQYLVDRGADVMVVSRTGQTTVDMANGPVQRISPFPSTIALLESLGAVNNHNCVAC